ncbi:hypothetical protein TanjilG_14179 [Lupinus angustifolius]|uniref:Uncharacterized protein n=1 Tax=Lupinus angustifolius TaxID=3871 RepID=A0A1J7HKA0_LUPAN|nr:hypothetical protein TanjilG_14179 [Lupinus angustifolius]
MSTSSSTEAASLPPPEVPSGHHSPSSDSIDSDPSSFKPTTVPRTQEQHASLWFSSNSFISHGEPSIKISKVMLILFFVVEAINTLPTSNLSIFKVVSSTLIKTPTESATSLKKSIVQTWIGTPTHFTHVTLSLGTYEKFHFLTDLKNEMHPFSSS